jgi:hypothetical protein
MTAPTSPEAVVQRQLDAYNARDLDALLATYAPDARQYVHPATLVANGHDDIRARLAPRLQEPNLHARLIQRLVMDTLVIDYEEVRRDFPEGPGTVELVAIYDVADGRIQSQIVKLGKQRLDAPAA